MRGGAAEMKAGRELDRAVAERVMGWQPGPCNDHCTVPGLHRWHLPDGTWRLESEVPAYSTAIAAAFALVDRLREIGLDFVLSFEDDGYEVEVITTEVLYQQGYQGCYAWGRSAAEAICRAALTSLARPPGAAGEGEA